MKRGRRTLWIGGTTAALGIAAALFVFTPRQVESFEPGWLMAIEPHKRKQTPYTISPGSGRPTFDVVVTQGSWDVKMTMAQFAEKVRKGFKSADGWKEEKRSLSDSVTWSKLEGTNSYSIYVMDLGDKLLVQSHASRRLSWPEKAQQWIRKALRPQA